MLTKYRLASLTFLLSIIFYSCVKNDNTEIFQYKTNTFIKNWLLCGPFPNCQNCSNIDFFHGENCHGFYTDYLESIGGEKNAVPHAGMALKYSGLKRDMKWFSYNSKTDKIALNDIFSPNDMVVTYAFCRIKSLEQQKTILALGSNDGIQVFLNRKKIHENHPRSGRWLQQDNDYVPVELKKGVNNLMLKIDEGTGDFGFMARFLDYDSTLTSLSKDIDKHKELKLLYYNDTLIAQFGRPYKIATLNPDSKVTIEIIHETKGKLGKQTVAPGAEAVFGLENMPDGFLTARASFPLLKENTIVSEARHYIGKLKRHKSPVLLNKDLMPVSETGRPFFPIGTYGAPPEDYNQLKEAGYNFVVASAENLDKVYEAGLMAAVPVHEDIHELLNHYKEHPAVLSWMLYDEPGYNRADILEIFELYNTAYEIDPRHPSYLVITDPKVYKTFGRCCDILSVDTYPVANGVIADVGENIASAYNASDGDQPVWHCGQLFSWPGQRIPTIREHRFMTYVALIRGVKGLLWYTYKGYGQYLPVDYPALWKAHKKLLKEINELSPVFMAGGPGADIELTVKQVDITGIMKKSPVGWYIIAANQSTTDSISPGFIIDPDYSGEITVIGENRSLKAENGRFRDDFHPLDVHVYKLSDNSEL